MQKVIPGILEQDPKETELKLKLFESVEGLKWVHVDIADGRFVSNTTHSVQEIPKTSRNFKLEVHLMVQHPEDLFAACWQAGADTVVFHAAAERDEAKLQEELTKYPFERTLGLNLADPLEAVQPYLSKIQAVLLMSIEAGEQGRPFQEQVFGRIRKAKELYPSLSAGVDGGVKEHNIREIMEAGADYVIVGSAIMKAEDPGSAFQVLEDLARSGG